MDPSMSDPSDDRRWANTGHGPESSAHPDEERDDRTQELRFPPRSDLGRGREDSPRSDWSREREGSPHPDLGRERSADARSDLGRERSNDGRPDLGSERFDDAHPDLNRGRSNDARPDLGRERFDDARSDLGRERSDDARPDLGRERFDDAGPDLRRERLDDPRSDLDRGWLDDARPDLGREREDDPRPDLGREREDDARPDLGREREDEARPVNRHRARRRSWKFITLVTTVSVVVLVGVTASIVTVIAPGKKHHPVVGFVPTGSTPEQDGEQITTAFLTAWRAGNLGLAASYTDNPQAAQAALTAYREGLHLATLSGSPTGTTDVTASPPTAGAPTANTPAATPSTPRIKVAFAVNAQVAAQASTGPVSAAWSYHSSLVAYQKPDSPAWSIAWAPDDLAPNLTATTHLAAVPVAPQATSVTDAGGNSLTSYLDPGLTNIAGALKTSPPKSLGKPGLAVEIQSADGTAVKGSQAVIVAAVDGTLATTIDATVERAARSAVAEHPQSSLIAIQPSTGQILAIANNAGYNDFALTAAVAPGSTGKIISAAALISQGVLTASTPVECPAVYTVQGINYHNDKDESAPASTPFSDDFAQSCNNAFSQWWEKESGGRLAAVAQQYFGLNLPWDIGLGHPATYYKQPPTASGSELAQNMFGQGHLTASPIAMASVAATVATGTFKQPILLPGAAQTAATPLPANVDAQLKTMMRAVVTQGTAAGLGFGPTVYAKTGTADVDKQGQPNSWFVAFDPAKDVAVACLVLNAGYGAQFAAPEVQHFLSNF